MWPSPGPGQPGRRGEGRGDRYRHRSRDPQGQPENAEGKTFDLVAGEEVTNLQNLKVGDVVALRYLQLLDLELLKGTAGVRKRVVEVDGSKAAAGEQPGAGAGMQVTIYADVIDVDKAQQTIRVKGVDNTLTLKVKDPAQFALIAKGIRSRRSRPRQSP